MALSQLAWANLKAVEAISPSRELRMLDDEMHGSRAAGFELDLKGSAVVAIDVDRLRDSRNNATC